MAKPEAFHRMRFFCFNVPFCLSIWCFVQSYICGNHETMKPSKTEVKFSISKRRRHFTNGNDGKKKAAIATFNEIQAACHWEASPNRKKTTKKQKKHSVYGVSSYPPWLQCSIQKLPVRVEPVETIRSPSLSQDLRSMTSRVVGKFPHGPPKLDNL